VHVFLSHSFFIFGELQFIFCWLTHEKLLAFIPGLGELGFNVSCFASKGLRGLLVFYFAPEGLLVYIPLPGGHLFVLYFVFRVSFRRSFILCTKGGLLVKRELLHLF
jgi:hypothetical protein